MLLITSHKFFWVCARIRVVNAKYLALNDLTTECQGVRSEVTVRLIKF
jgi:hypothetical protein